MLRSTIHIQTGSRLHFGLLAHAPGRKRQFGGAGMMIDSPGLSLTVTPAQALTVQADSSLRERIRSILDRLRQKADFPREPFALIVEHSIPEHCGFGSGTQLSLAVAQAVKLFGGENQPASVTELAAWTGRGKRSAIGLHGFCTGGFLVDGGKADSDSPAPLLSRINFPEGWRILLITPPDTQGLAGRLEQFAFDRLPPMSQRCTDRLCGLLLLEILPALQERDFDAFCESLFQYGKLAGEYFEPMQGGVYAHPLMRELADTLQSEGVRGVGQTSWGPSLFVICRDTSTAESLRSDFSSRPPWERCIWQMTCGRNRGADLTILEG